MYHDDKKPEIELYRGATLPEEYLKMISLNIGSTLIFSEILSTTESKTVANKNFKGNALFIIKADFVKYKN